MKKDNQTFILADAATCKHPTESQLYDIVMQTYATASKILDTPKIALLSFSTLGSGGHDDSMTMIQNVIKRVRVEHPDILIDGELQLDAAVSPKVAAKKAPNSPVAGSANVLICPDLNSGNILYKSLEQFAGFTAAGPILQGFNYPASDLSRGSTVEDVVEVINALEQIKWTRVFRRDRNKLAFAKTLLSPDLKRKNVYSCRLPAYDIFSFQVVWAKG